MVKADVNDIQYYEDHMEGIDVEAIEHRNKHKSEILFKLYSTGKVHDIAYRLYLIHVIWNMYCMGN